MKEWYQRKKSKTRKSRKSSEHYNVWDFFVDALMWLPELIVFPLRLIFWLIRGLIRSIGDIF